jgi:hypothetical protein
MQISTSEFVKFVKGCEDMANMLRAIAALAHELPDDDISQVVTLLQKVRPALWEIEMRLREKVEAERGNKHSSG